MGLLVPLEMEQPADLRKLVDNPPDSWEMADIEARMKLIRLPEPSCVTSGADAAVTESAPIPPVDDVDSVLREAVQNPRIRMTILRLEQEVERFLRNPKLQQLEFQPMRSSYLRLAAHRVAQHYFLQSTVVDSNSPEGSRIVARKTSESRYPSIRLADIPVELSTEDKPSSSGKVAIKQRPNKNLWGNGENGLTNGFGGKINTLKSMEERKEDYNRARARIFNGSDLAEKFGEDEAVELSVVKVKDRFIAESLKPKGNNNEEEICESVRIPTDLLGGARVHKKPERELLNKAKVNNKVAIFRDHEKDRRDPDYDRNHDKYIQRFDPGFGLTASPVGLQGIYGPLVNYNTEFPQLGGHPRPQIHMKQPPPCPLPQQMTWMSPVSSLGYRPPDAYLGHFNQPHCAPHTATAMYMHSPQLAYHGPSIAYTFSHDCYQQPFTQPPPQPQPQQQQHQKPEASINQARCR
ncbi:hypothetical protein O6H91_09G111900 [Diphasiastrum complanatum]|uniref:Uncharacterized protein n=6 Tax=Diphasiastrum complanatum TaxID=34168 RepID=A0ACC2CT96_DIPCM|nr:hypothetical protein O6H91_Y044400 [Diphasiastrum complanatum]KAJ7297632.1 hypothetical protein O6H91_Y044400 [Diphasiastrum complanatum]KAJ7545234.1 hypothetical protein O6H91_09G111900 [Diphasiastrum complanatum]KAJ7545235.1 hypothetical protein O6H91_09G111900 [Diphasiastrum complanatum]KAJ7545237.1 hypothetical protein O6H91_09G111900 [Diphasiastrum complanatum]